MVQNERKMLSHLALAFGIHLCAGMNVARLEARIAGAVSCAVCRLSDDARGSPLTLVASETKVWATAPEGSAESGGRHEQVHSQCHD
jgi:hypothetical protein